MHRLLKQVPACKLYAVTPSDTVALTEKASALWVGGAGNVAIKTPGASAAVTIVGVPAGTVLPIQAEYVMATNTTATNIVALR
jgi:hypothetical protein